MADPTKPKRKVTGQIPLSNPTTPSTSATRTQPRARAKVDPSSISSSAVSTPPSRPTLRSAPSSASLRSTLSTNSTPPTRPSLPHHVSATKSIQGTITPHARLVRVPSSTPPISPMTPATLSTTAGNMGPPASLHRGTTTPVPRVKTTASYRAAGGLSPEPPAVHRGAPEPTVNASDTGRSASMTQSRVRAYSRAGSDTNRPVTNTTARTPSADRSNSVGGIGTARKPLRSSSPAGPSLGRVDLTMSNNPSTPGIDRARSIPITPVSGHNLSVPHTPLLSPGSFPQHLQSDSRQVEDWSIRSNIGISNPSRQDFVYSPEPLSRSPDGENHAESSSPPRHGYPLSATTTPISHHHFSHYAIQHPTASCPPSPAPPSSNFPGENPNDASRLQQAVPTNQEPTRKSLVFTRSTSPLSQLTPAERRSRVRMPLPFNPHQHPPSLPLPPTSPELRTIALPTMTPVRTRSDYTPSSSRDGDSSGDARRLSGSGSELSNLSSGQPAILPPPMLDDANVGVRSSIQNAIRLNQLIGTDRSDRDRLSGSTVVEEDEIEGRGGKLLFLDSDGETKSPPEDLDVVLGIDAEQAKINRKIADLEISNASLMAINRSLEAKKDEQRTELSKLRRLIRTSLPSTSGTNILLTLSSSNNSTYIPQTPTQTQNINTGLGFDEEYFDEIEDPELEARWERIGEVVLGMRKRGEEAVNRGLEVGKVAGQRVLNFQQVEEGGEGEVDGEGEGEGEMSMVSETSLGISPDGEEI